MKIEPSINYGQLLISLSFIGSILGAFFLVREDIAVLKVQVQALYLKDARDEERLNVFRVEVVGELRAMNEKLQQLNERMARQEGRR